VSVSHCPVIMKMEFLRSRTTPKKQVKTTNPKRSSHSQPPDSLAIVNSTEEGIVETAYPQTKKPSQEELDMSEIVKGVTSSLSDMSELVKGMASQFSLSPSKKDSVDVILDSDEDSDEIFMDEDDDDNDDDDNDLGTSRTWDESYGSGNVNETSPAGVVSAPASTMLRGSPSRLNARNAPEVDFAAMAAANAAFCVVPVAPILRHGSEDTPSTRQRSASISDGSEGGKKKGSSGHSSEDYTDDEDEGEDGYKPGGYHPVKLGEVYNER
jgi:hypothetical protein